MEMITRELKSCKSNRIELLKGVKEMGQVEENEILEDKDEELQELIITLEDGEGRGFDCTVLTTFEVNKREYIALLPHDVDENGDSNIHLYRYRNMIQGGQEGIEITPIQSDMEFEAALSVFETLIESSS